MTMRERVNGHPIRWGAVAGILSGVVAAAATFIGLHMSLIDRLRAEWELAAENRMRIQALESWVADYERNVRPLRDEFLRLTGELKGLPSQIGDLKIEMRRLNDRLDRMERTR